MAKQSRRTRYSNADAEAQSLICGVDPLNDRQAEYIAAIESHEQVITVGSSGTGKTWIAATMAANALLTGEADKLILTRPYVTVGRSSGALPGTLGEKYDPVFAPVMDVIKEQVGKGKVDSWVKSETIEMAPLEYMRGRSFKSAWIICDESQNLTEHEALMLVTRIGDGCKAIFNGDLRQSDIRADSGLAKMIRLARDGKVNVPVIEFGPEHIVRGGLVREWLTSW